LPLVLVMAVRCRALVALAALLALGGCATSTRMAKMGPLPTTEPLVTLIVSDDRAVVERECREVHALGPILGCSLWRTVSADGTTTVKVMKIVRYTSSKISSRASDACVSLASSRSGTTNGFGDTRSSKSVDCRRDSDGFEKQITSTS